MKKIVPLFILAACGAPQTTPPPVDNSALVEGCGDVPAGKQEVIVDADLLGNTTWTADKVYRLGGVIAVADGTLTIEAGTTIQGTVAQKSALIVTSTGKIASNGTAASPVVFTSCKNVGERAPGDWGGVALLGKASLNTSTGTNPLEGLPEDDRFQYGGGATPDDAHDCGSVKYTRFEFAGQAFQTDKELNSFTLAACGSTTVVDYVQAHLGRDDLIEFFGGTVNVKHLVLTHGDDDAFDWQLGWRGRAQYVLFQQFVSAQAERGIEADNSEFNMTASPYSDPILANFTLIGAGKDTMVNNLKQNGAVLRRGTRGHIVNTIFTEFRGAAVVVTDKQKVRENGAEVEKADPARDNFMDGSLKLDHVLLFNNGELGSFEADAMIAETTNMIELDPLLADVLNQDLPNAKPAAGSPALDASRALDATTLDAFFEAAPFVGAIGTTDWTLGWTAYPKN